eukprot:918107-Prymnesium_polylepis.1
MAMFPQDESSLAGNAAHDGDPGCSAWVTSTVEPVDDLLGAIDQLDAWEWLFSTETLQSDSSRADSIVHHDLRTHQNREIIPTAVTSDRDPRLNSVGDASHKSNSSQLGMLAAAEDLADRDAQRSTRRNDVPSANREDVELSQLGSPLPLLQAHSLPLPQSQVSGSLTESISSHFSSASVTPTPSEQSLLPADHAALPQHWTWVPTNTWTAPPARAHKAEPALHARAAARGPYKKKTIDE